MIMRGRGEQKTNDRAGQARPARDRWQAVVRSHSFAAMRGSWTIARVVTAGGVCAATIGCPRVAWAQQSGSTIQPEIRVDLLAAHTTAGQLGAGAVGSAGEYLRVGGDLGAGVVGGDSRGVRLGARADVYGRFHLDPLAQSRWAPYLVAGGSFRADQRSRGQLYALAALGVEGPASHHVVPAFELGLGGGVRVGIALRRALTNHR
jgi:hypothetical protein